MWEFVWLEGDYVIERLEYEKMFLMIKVLFKKIIIIIKILQQFDNGCHYSLKDVKEHKKFKISSYKPFFVQSTL